MRVLVACEWSGVVREAFRARGHDAVSCDLRPSALPGPHVQGDALALLGDSWDLVIAHPPCTFLSCIYTGSWSAERRRSQRAALRFFRAFLAAPAARIAVENPTMRADCRAVVGEPSQAVQPWQFGDGYSKRTCLWTRGLRPLRPWVRERPAGVLPFVRWRDLVSGSRVHRAMMAARTPPGLAAAMAEQWGCGL